MRYILAGMVALACFMGFNSKVHATIASYSGYICQVNYETTVSLPGGYGQYGALHVWITGGASCTGTGGGDVYFCTTGATNTNCNTSWLFDEPTLLALLQAFENAIHIKTGGSKVSIYYDTTKPKAAVNARFDYN